MYLSNLCPNIPSEVIVHIYIVQFPPYMKMYHKNKSSFNLSTITNTSNHIFSETLIPECDKLHSSKELNIPDFTPNNEVLLGKINIETQLYYPTTAKSHNLPNGLNHNANNHNFDNNQYSLHLKHMNGFNYNDLVLPGTSKIKKIMWKLDKFRSIVDSLLRFPNSNHSSHKININHEYLNNQNLALKFVAFPLFNKLEDNIDEFPFSSLNNIHFTNSNQENAFVPLCHLEGNNQNNIIQNNFRLKNLISPQKGLSRPNVIINGYANRSKLPRRQTFNNETSRLGNNNNNIFIENCEYSHYDSYNGYSRPPVINDPQSFANTTQYSNKKLKLSKQDLSYTAFVDFSHLFSSFSNFEDMTNFSQKEFIGTKSNIRLNQHVPGISTYGTRSNNSVKLCFIENPDIFINFRYGIMGCPLIKNSDLYQPETNVYTKDNDYLTIRTERKNGYIKAEESNHSLEIDKSSSLKKKKLSSLKFGREARTLRSSLKMISYPTILPKVKDSFKKLQQIKSDSYDNLTPDPKNMMTLHLSSSIHNYLETDLKQKLVPYENNPSIPYPLPNDASKIFAEKKTRTRKKCQPLPSLYNPNNPNDNEKNQSEERKLRWLKDEQRLLNQQLPPSRKIVLQFELLATNSCPNANKRTLRDGEREDDIKFLPDNYENCCPLKKEEWQDDTYPVAINIENSEGDSIITPIRNNHIQTVISNSAALKCPWCYTLCIDLYAFLKHFNLFHFRFRYYLQIEEALIVIRVIVNENYQSTHKEDLSNFMMTSGLISHKGSSLSPSHHRIYNVLPFTEILAFKSNRPKYCRNLMEFCDPSSFSNYKNALQELNSCNLLHYPNQIKKGHDRIYFRSLTYMPLMPEDIDYDSESESNPQWLIDKRCNLIDDFTDVDDFEKEFMKIWNRFMMSNKGNMYLGECHMFEACKKFISLNNYSIRSKNLSKNLIFHLCQLYHFELISSQQHSQLWKTFTDTNI
ncbi:uncharacterized protein LOC135926100 [Gordionus sp. m RMFG-2023]|uniref:uncharacterized protein LOC135926100 n=1 Tax=Gordionus sp. m RMFG-2023 TaxID=3053472 RepID=UPI0031FBCFA0